MPRITDITTQKRRSDVYNLFVDGKFLCGVGALELSSSGLKVGQELSEQEVVSIVQQSQGSKAHNAALRYLSYRPRSEFEVRDYVYRKDYSEAICNEVIERLKREGFVDDQAFAESWIRSRSATKPRSQRVLRLELSNKRVPKDVIDAVLADQSEDEELTALKQIAQKKLQLSRYQNDVQKLMQYLMSQGFRYSDVKKVLAELAVE